MKIQIEENVPLKNLTTFRIGGLAAYFLRAKSEDDLREAITFVKSRKLPIFLLGGGSNLLISDKGILGLVIRNEIKGIKFTDLPAKAGQLANKVLLEIGAGEVWDEVVALTVARNLSGLENLSGIPGTVGGAVVQNAGAYGAELKDCVVSVSGLNSVTGKKFNFNNDDCQYSYRNSFFKKNKKFVITSVVLLLDKKFAPNVEYAGLKKELGTDGEVTLAKIREAVLAIRARKLPDWRHVGTAGSFFQNPIITEKEYKKILSTYKDLPSFPFGKGKVKIAIGWILDHVFNLRGYVYGQAGIHRDHALAIINLGAATAKEVAELSVHIKKLVKEKTGIEIEEEVERI